MEFPRGMSFLPTSLTSNLMSVLLIRMLKYPENFYEFAEMDRDKLLNSIMFADDATIVVSGATHFEVNNYGPNNFWMQWQNLQISRTRN